MAFVAVLDGCRARYEGRTSRKESDVSFCVLVKDDGATVVQRLESGVKPHFWNSGGQVEAFVAGGRMLFRSFSREGETLEVEGTVRLLSNVGGEGCRVAVKEVDALPPEGERAVPAAARPAPAAPPPPAREPRGRAAQGFDARQAAKLAQLRAWRTRRSRELGLPPYVVARDDMLEDLVAAWPTDYGTLRVVRGMGPKRCTQFGEELLALFAG
jgi:hypothetical protein